VALTRGRDRVYLSGSVPKGAFRPGRGSLGEVLPASMRALFAAAVPVPGGVASWTGPSGRAHAFFVPDPANPRDVEPPPNV
jgi:hypothetical protein